MSPIFWAIVVIVGPFVVLGIVLAFASADVSARCAEGEGDNER